MPVGTRGSIKYLSAADYERLGAEIVLGNTYHLMLRPGAETVAHFGGLGAFAGWDGLTLTDSGGFQVFSLEPKVDDDGVTFKSTYDGSQAPLHPGSCRDHPGTPRCRHPDGARRVPSTAVRHRGRAAGRGAHRLPGRHVRRPPTIARIRPCSASCRVGSTKRCGRRAPSARWRSGSTATASVASVWARPAPEMLPALAATIAHLPADRPRYLMGVGDPASLVEAVALGVDQFDCVMQTRIGRHGIAMTGHGKVHVKNAQSRAQRRPSRPRMRLRGLYPAQPRLHPPPVPGG